jgi:NAD dependent epimerase/dehydratase
MASLNRQVLVTGAGGFIGSHLTEALVRRGHRVRALVHYNCQNRWGWLDSVPADVSESLEVVPADICDPFAVRKAVAGCDTVFHLAALIAIPYSYLAPASYVEVNVKGTLNVLQACLDTGVNRVVHTSTSEVYGTAQYVPINERHPVVAQSPYSASKIAADSLAESYYRSFDLPVATIRPFNTFGPRQSARAIIPTLVVQALSGANVISLGSLDPVRDFNYVKDTVRGFIAVAASDRAIGRVTNIGRGEGVSIAELAKMVLDICGCSARTELDRERVRPPKSEVFELICDNRQAQEILDWRPQYSLRQGLEETVAWMQANLRHYKSGLYNR